MPDQTQVASLNVSGANNQFVVTLTFDEGDRCLLSDQLVAFEYWASANNNRANAAKRGSELTARFVDPDYQSNVTRYWWTRPLYANGETGDWYPASASAGVSATTRRIVTNDIEDDAITTEKLVANAVTADKASFNSLSAVTSSFGDANFSGVVKDSTGNIINIDFTSGTIDCSGGFSFG